jgi:hypothetical protein
MRIACLYHYHLEQFEKYDLWISQLYITKVLPEDLDSTYHTAICWFSFQAARTLREILRVASYSDNIQAVIMGFHRQDRLKCAF